MGCKNCKAPSKKTSKATKAPVWCDECGGHGFRHGIASHTCSTCQGSGLKLSSIADKGAPMDMLRCVNAKCKKGHPVIETTETIISCPACREWMGMEALPPEPVLKHFVAHGYIRRQAWVYIEAENHAEAVKLVLEGKGSLEYDMEKPSVLDFDMGLGEINEVDE